MTALYADFERFYWKRAPLIQVIFGAFLTAVAGFLVVIALLVFAQQSNEASQRHKEANTVRSACVRARTFGPPLIDFLEQAEGRLNLGPLERVLTVGGKKQSVISFYRSTIPANCPPQ